MNLLQGIFDDEVEKHIRNRACGKCESCGDFILDDGRVLLTKPFDGPVDDIEAYKTHFKTNARYLCWLCAKTGKTGA